MRRKKSIPRHYYHIFRIEYSYNSDSLYARPDAVLIILSEDELSHIRQLGEMVENNKLFITGEFDYRISINFPVEVEKVWYEDGSLEDESDSYKSLYIPAGGRIEIRGHDPWVNFSMYEHDNCSDICEAEMSLDKFKLMELEDWDFIDKISFPKEEEF